jgi:hypothetical protein
MAGKGRWVTTQAEEDGLFALVEDTLKALRDWPEFRPATVSEIARHLETEHHARTGN